MHVKQLHNNSLSNINDKLINPIRSLFYWNSNANENSVLNAKPQLSFLLNNLKENFLKNKTIYNKIHQTMKMTETSKPQVRINIIKKFGRKSKSIISHKTIQVYSPKKLSEKEEGNITKIGLQKKIDYKKIKLTKPIFKNELLKFVEC